MANQVERKQIMVWGERVSDYIEGTLDKAIASLQNLKNTSSYVADRAQLPQAIRAVDAGDLSSLFEQVPSLCNYTRIMLKS